MVRSDFGKRMVFWDGGMGTMMQERGLQPGELPETWNVLHKEDILAIQKAYASAGADIINANTFGANRFKYGSEGELSLENLITQGVHLAKQAIAETGSQALVSLDIGPTGKMLQPLGDLAFADAIEVFAEVCRIGAAAGADLILIETMCDAYETKAAVLAAKEQTDLPVFVSLTFGEDHRLLTGTRPEGMVAMLEGLGVDAIGLNCGLGPEQMRSIAREVLAVASVPVFVNPNAGLPRSENGRTVYDVRPEAFANVMHEIALDGAWAIGGCCGTTPEHIKKLVETCADIVPKPVTEKNRTVVTSYGDTVVFDQKTVVIGERINPTGKKKFKEALKNHDINYIVSEGLKQEAAGAQVLDVNVGLPGIDEPAMMADVSRALQDVMTLPLQIDTSDPEALERALRAYNGKAMVNSVNGKEENMKAVLPIVKKYGGVLVCLLLDEAGIPATVEGRLAVAEKIIQRAADYGIAKKDLIFDALCMTISTDENAANVTLRTVRELTETYGVKTVLGVSNISFGLPVRENITSAFLTMAMQNGLSAAIINPNSYVMMKAWRVANTLRGFDPSCSAYIEAYAGEAEEKKAAVPAAAKKTEAKETAATTGEEKLIAAVKKGLKEDAGAFTAELLKEKEPLSIINGCLVPALDEVGKLFEKGKLFLPQLLMSADAAQASFAEIRNFFEKSGKKQEEKGKIVLATVKGDIHDIGKNIVRVLLENYGYTVIDLGRDVPPEKVVEAARESGARLVGLSALMTTTVGAMEETIRLVHEELPGVAVLVGGAVLTESYAAEIHADAYAKDAMASVRFAEKYFGYES